MKIITELYFPQTPLISCHKAEHGKTKDNQCCSGKASPGAYEARLDTFDFTASS